MSNKPDTSRPFLKYQGAKILSDGLSETVLDQDQRHMTSQLVYDDPLMTLDTLVYQDRRTNGQDKRYHGAKILSLSSAS